MSEAASPPPVERRRFPRRWRRGRRALVGLLALMMLGVIGYVAFWRVGPPLLARVSPSPAHVGGTVILDGQGFDPTLEGNVVYFDDYSGRVVKAGRTRLEVEVPDIEMAGTSQVVRRGQGAGRTRRRSRTRCRWSSCPPSTRSPAPTGR